MDKLIRYAGFWQRVIAYLIDSLLIGTVGFVIFIPLLGIVALGILGSEFHFFCPFCDSANVPSDFDIENFPGIILLIIIGCIAAMMISFLTKWLYYALMESSSHQATVGKIVLRLKVTDLQGERITFGRATGRYFGRILSGLFLGMGFLMAAFTQQKQTLHDIIAGTLVIEK